MTILVTGSAGFIGSNFVLEWLTLRDEPVVSLDKLTYAGNPRNLAALDGDARHRLVIGDIGDIALVQAVLTEHRPRAVLNFAAESHVDRSIHGPDDFMQTNVVGTCRLLQCVRAYWAALPENERAAFRLLHVSTDEVYGSLQAHEAPFVESRAYAPNSPYAASKAASDHLMRAWRHTYGLPVLTTNCSNNYGPFQFPEKLIPLCIHNALAGKPLPIYGDGGQIRDWLYVKDHCAAVREVLERGRIGETYNIGANEERANVDLVRQLCGVLDELSPRGDGRSYSAQIEFVPDRPGHDRRYAMDSAKLRGELGWRANDSFDSGIRKTVRWYLDNQHWVREVTSGAFRDWVNAQYGQ